MLAVLVFVGVPGAFAAPFADRTALKTAVDNCLAAVPSGERCCSEGGADCGAAGLVDMPLWDVSQVTDMRFLFTYCDGWGWCEYNVLDSRSFNEDISGWDTSQVTNMRYLFFDAPKFNQPIGSWDTSKVTRHVCHVFKRQPVQSTYRVGTSTQVTDMY